MSVSKRMSQAPSKRKNPWAVQASGDALSEFRSLDSKLVHDALGWVMERGDMFAITATSDGGALSLTVVSKGRHTKIYCKTRDELEEALSALEGDSI